MFFSIPRTNLALEWEALYRDREFLVSYLGPETDILNQVVSLPGKFRDCSQIVPRPLLSSPFLMNYLPILQLSPVGLQYEQLKTPLKINKYSRTPDIESLFPRRNLWQYAEAGGKS